MLRAPARRRYSSTEDNMNRRRLLLIVALAVPSVASFTPRSADAACVPGDMACGWMQDYNKHIPFWWDSHHHAGEHPGSGYHAQQGGPWAADEYHASVEDNYTMEMHGCCAGVPPGSCGQEPEGGLLEHLNPAEMPMATPFVF